MPDRDRTQRWPIRAKFSRVFPPAGPPAAILLYTLAPDLLLGWPRANRPEECVYMLPDICTRPEVGRITGRGNTANLESVIALKPDLILDVGSTSERSSRWPTRVQEQTGIPYALLDGRFVALAHDLSKARRADRAARPRRRSGRYAQRTFDDHHRPHRHRRAERAPARLLCAGPARAGDRPRRLDQCRDHRAAGAERRRRQQGGLANVSIEQVLLWNPDVIVTIDQDFAAAVRSDPAWASVKAVRDNRVHLSPKMPFGWVDFPPSVNRLIGLWWLAKILYPDMFPEDMRALDAGFLHDVLSSSRRPTRRSTHVLAGRD